MNQFSFMNIRQYGFVRLATISPEVYLGDPVHCAERAS